MAKRSCGLTFSMALLVTALLSGSAGYAQPKPKPPDRGVVDPSARPKSTTELPKYYALVIGNNNYQYVTKLQTAVSDANAVAQVLRDAYGFNTKVLVNATRDDIFTALVGYRRSLTQNSNLLIYYAGHGYLDRDADAAYWLPVDAEKDNNMNWVSADDITRAVRTIPSRHVLVISDSCYSGAILGDPANRDIGTGMKPLEKIAYLEKIQSAKSRNWMASGSKEPVPDGSPGGHTRFANALLTGLIQMKDNQFAAGDLFYLYVKRWVAGSSPQMPLYGSIRESGDEFGDFVFSRGAAPLPDVPDPASVIQYQTGSGTGLTSSMVTTPPGSVDTEEDLKAIDAVLHQYQEGRKRKDAGALWKLWPSAPVETKQRLETYFKSASSIRTTLDMGTPEVGADRVTATVSGQIHEAYTPKNGDAPAPRDDSIVFTLKKNNGVWTIVDVK